MSYLATRVTSSCYSKNSKPHGALAGKSTKGTSAKSKHKTFSNSLIKKTPLLNTLSTQERKGIFMKAFITELTIMAKKGATSKASKMG